MEAIESWIEFWNIVMWIAIAAVVGMIAWYYRDKKVLKDDWFCFLMGVVQIGLAGSIMLQLPTIHEPPVENTMIMWSWMAIFFSYVFLFKGIALKYRIGPQERNHP